MYEKGGKETKKQSVSPEQCEGTNIQEPQTAKNIITKASKMKVHDDESENARIPQARLMQTKILC